MDRETRDALYRGFVAGFMGVHFMGMAAQSVRPAINPEIPRSTLFPNQPQSRDPRKYHPYLVVKRALRALGWDGKWTQGQELLAADFIHYWYGVFWGLVYALIEKRVPLPVLLKGWLLGMFLWSISFPGWIPALGIAEPAREMSKEDLWITLAAHTGYGVGTAAVYRALAEVARR
ncbi:MAG: hypothetical protein ACE5IZ_00930 [Dehalococcoidia bacterium]